MRYEDESWVKLYTRETPGWAVLPWEARALFLHVLRVVDRAGIMELGGDGLTALAALIRFPLGVVTEFMPHLVKSGAVVIQDARLLLPKFLEAQTAIASDKARKQKEREVAAAMVRAGLKEDQRCPVVYFIQTEGGGPIKIGFTEDLANRLAKLQTASSLPLLVLATTPGGAQLEKDLHEKFSPYRIKGEWFRPHQEILDTIRDLSRRVTRHATSRDVTNRRDENRRDESFYTDAAVDSVGADVQEPAAFSFVDDEPRTYVDVPAQGHSASTGETIQQAGPLPLQAPLPNRKPSKPAPAVAEPIPPQKPAPVAPVAPQTPPAPAQPALRVVSHGEHGAHLAFAKAEEARSRVFSVWPNPRAPEAWVKGYPKMLAAHDGDEAWVMQTVDHWLGDDWAKTRNPICGLEILMFEDKKNGDPMWLKHQGPKPPTPEALDPAEVVADTSEAGQLWLAMRADLRESGKLYALQALSGVRAKAFSDNRLTLKLPDGMLLPWMEHTYSELLADSLRFVATPDAALAFEVASDGEERKAQHG